MGVGQLAVGHELVVPDAADAALVGAGHHGVVEPGSIVNIMQFSMMIFGAGGVGWEGQGQAERKR